MADAALSRAVAQYKALPLPQRMAIVFALPVVVAGIFGYLLWRDLGTLGPDERVPGFMRRGAGGVWSEIATVRGNIEQKRAVIAELPAIRAQLKALQDDIAVAEERLPREAEKAQMREVIERLARDVPADLGTVRLKSVRITEGDTKGGARGRTSSSKAELQTITYQTEVEGDINGIIRFIDAVEKNPRFMSVTSIKINGGSVKADLDSKPPKVVYGMHAVRLDLVTYVYARKGGG